MARQKRRTFSAEFKFETVLEALKSEKSAAQICREREINEILELSLRDNPALPVLHVSSETPPSP